MGKLGAGGTRIAVRERPPTSLSMVVPMDMEERRLTNLPHWESFAQMTSVHGVRYVFDRSSIIIRRCMWLVLVSASFGLFVTQTVARTRDFMEYNTNIQAEIVYENDVRFPAVTLCNQNSFRITKAVEHGVYKTLGEIYSDNDRRSHSPLKEVLNSTTVKALDMADFLRDASHQIEDFIVRCSWAGKPCDMAKHFSAITTDYGICYTFNHDTNLGLVSAEAGANDALSLVLNVELYEYMKGPHTEAGIQVLLHNQTELPRVGDMGFSVATGTHTLVRINRKEFYNMPEPYGRCVEGSQPMSNCVLQGLESKQRQQCQCVSNFHTSYHEDITRCDIVQEFMCAADVTRNFSTSSTSCPVPCQRTTFEASLSYALITKYNMQFLDSVETKQLEDSYIGALEARQANRQKYITTNEQQVAAILDASNRLERALNASNVQLSDPEAWLASYGVPSVLDHVEDVFEADLVLIFHILDQKHYQLPHSATKIARRTYDVNEPQADLGDIKAFYDWLQTVIQPMTTACNETVVDITDTTGLELLDRVDVNDTDLCAWYAAHVTGNVTALVNLRYDTVIPEVLTQAEVYKSNLNAIFNGSATEASDFEAHNECISAIDRWQYAAQYIETVESYSSTVAVASNSTQLLAMLSTMTGIMNTSGVGAENTFGKKDFKICNWIEDASAVDGVGTNLYGDVTRLQLTIRDYTLAVSMLDSAIAYLQNVVVSLTEGLIVYQERFVPLMARLELYREGALRKVDIADDFLQLADTKTLSTFASAIDRYIASLERIDEVISTAEYLLTKGLLELMTFTIPVLDYYSLQHTHFWKTFMLNSNDLGITQLTNATLEGRSWPPDVAIVIGEVMKPYEALAAERFVTRQEEVAFDTAMAVFRTNVEAYQQEATMDEKFYITNIIELDLFYKDLSYEVTRQRASFESMSLLGEVGGFLGLLLGASALTVFELADYFCMLLVTRLSEKRADKTKLKTSCESA